MPIYSHSRLSTYENCPHQYKLRYIDRIKPEDKTEGIEAFMGSRVHDVLEMLHKELILTKLNSIDDLLKFYHAEWDRNWHENIVIVKKGFTSSHYRESGEKAIRSYYERYNPFDQSKTLATEKLISFKIGDYTLQGYIDRLSYKGNGRYEIHDYKTSGYLQEQEKFDDERQLALYQIGIREKFRDAQDITLIWHYLLFDREIVSIRSDADLKDLKKEIVSLIKTIESDTKFQPHETGLCDWCEFPDYCVAKRHEKKVKALPPNKYLEEEGVSLVNKYASVRADIKDLKGREKELQEELDLIEEAAIEYASKEDVTSITGSDYMLKISEDTVLGFPRSGDEGREELEELIKKAGIWEDVSSLTLSRLSKLIEIGELDSRDKYKLLKYAEEIENIKVKLVKKKDE